eukprot:gene4361-6169_t
MSELKLSLHSLVLRSDIESIKAIPVDELEQQLFVRDEFQQSPLASAIRIATKALKATKPKDIYNDSSTISNPVLVVDYLLRNGGTSTVFVKGYLPDSLVCSLPQAVQPHSSVVEFVPPLRGSDPVLISKVDEELSQFVKLLQETYEKEQQAIKEADIKQKDAEKYKNDNLSKKFNPFPALLKVGDTVVRVIPPSFGTNSTGTVESIINNFVQVKWHDTNSISPYTYDSKSSTSEIKLHDPNPNAADPPAGPSSQPLTPSSPSLSQQLTTSISSSPNNIDDFEVGDLVILTHEKNNIYPSKEMNCLGDPTINPSIGVIINANPKTKDNLCTISNSPLRGGYGGSYGGGYVAAQVDPNARYAKVVSCTRDSEGPITYYQNDLSYADGSNPGKAPDSHAIRPVVKTVPVLPPTTSGPPLPRSGFGGGFSGFGGGRPSATNLANRKYKIGDEVYIKRTGNNNRSRFRGVVTNCYGATEYEIMNNDPSSSSYNSLTNAEEDDLKFANLPPKQVPLVVGDRVTLSKNFPLQDGWCLGKNYLSGKVGIVVYAPTAKNNDSKKNKNYNQRNVLVVPDEEISSNTSGIIAAPFSFCSDWLERAHSKGSNSGDVLKDLIQASISPNSSILSNHKSLASNRYGYANIMFSEGDRVQLNPGNWIAKSPTTRSKCLGVPTDNLYGIVKKVGPLRDGVQRNVEVYAICQDSKERGVSLYPSYALVLANRHTVVANGEEFDSLVEAVQDFSELASLSINASALVKKFGLQVWSQFFHLCGKSLGIDAIHQARSNWDQSRSERIWCKSPHYWDLDLEESIKNQIEELENEEKAAYEKEYKSIIKSKNDSSTGNEESTHWTCNACTFAFNLSDTEYCSVCDSKGFNWSCICTALNFVGHSTCKACLISKVIAEELIEHQAKTMADFSKGFGEVKPTLSFAAPSPFSSQFSQPSGFGGKAAVASSGAFSSNPFNVNAAVNPNSGFFGGNFGAPATATTSPASTGGLFSAPATGGFGGFSAPTATSSFATAGTFSGSFGAPATSASGFGGFGAPATATASPAPTGSFGGFGAPATTTTSPAPTGGFGAPATSTTSPAPVVGLSGFGTPATTTTSPAPTGGFGGFGAPATTTTSPAPTGGFGAPATTTTSPAPTGGFGGFRGPATTTTTTNPAPLVGFSVYVAPPTTTTGAFSFIGTPAATTTSPAPTGGFGGFGAPATTTTSPAPTGGFGGFGAPATTTTSPAPTGGFGGFGAPATTTSPAPTGGFGGFGAPVTTTIGAFSGIGTPATTTTSPAPTGGFGGFGAPATTTIGAFSGIGTPATTTTSPTPTSGFGGFGAPATTSTSPTPTGGFSGFGSPATTTTSPAPAVGFGAPATSATSHAPTSGFGGFGAPATSATSPDPAVGFGGFGAPVTFATSPAPAVGFSFSGFGASTTITTGAFSGIGTPGTTTTSPAPTGGFGASATTSTSPTPTSGYGGFGAQATSATSPAPAVGFGGFGAPATTATSPVPTGGFGGFSAQATIPTSPSFGFGGFGAQATTPTSPAPAFGFGGFGTTTSSPAPAGGFSGFGSSVTSTTSPALAVGFGAPVTIPASGFGAPATITTSAAPVGGLSGFGAPATTATSAAPAGGFGGFGAPSSTTAGSFGGFGAPPTTLALRLELMNLYTWHNPSKLKNVDQLLEKYKGREAELISKVKSKYENIAIKTIGNMPTFDDKELFGEAKFTPVVLTERNKQGQQIEMKLHAITAMNEFSDKTFEEIRNESYPKGNQQSDANDDANGKVASNEVEDQADDKISDNVKITENEVNNNVQVVNNDIVMDDTTVKVEDIDIHQDVAKDSSSDSKIIENADVVKPAEVVPVATEATADDNIEKNKIDNNNETNSSSGPFFNHTFVKDYSIQSADELAAGANKVFFKLPGVKLNGDKHAHALQLQRTVYGGSYNCDVCRRSARGPAYHCNLCNFDAHPHCWVDFYSQIEQGENKDNRTFMIIPKLIVINDTYVKQQSTEIIVGVSGVKKPVKEDLDEESDDENTSSKDKKNNLTPAQVGSDIPDPIESDEYKHNLKVQEKNYYTMNNNDKLESPSHSISDALGPSLGSLPSPASLPTRQSSVYFFSTLEYEPIESITQLIKSKDKSGNSALHHCAFIGLIRTYEALIESGASKWLCNNNNIPAAAIMDGVATLDPIIENLAEDDNNEVNKTYIREIPQLKFDDVTLKLYKYIRRRMLLPRHLIQAIFRTSLNYMSPESLSHVIDEMLDMKKEEALALSAEAVELNIPHARVYRGIALLDAGYGIRAAQRELDLYFAEFSDIIITTKPSLLDPMVLFLIYLLWKEDDSIHKRSKSAKLRAADALVSFRCFHELSSLWLLEDDNIDKKVREGLDTIEPNEDDNEDSDEEEDVAPILTPTDPEYQWKIAKKNHSVSSPSMDKLMELTGMHEVKVRAMNVCKEVILAKHRPKEIQAKVAMNFLFVGNPGTGKTTVATLLASAMVELGFRKNATPIITSANDILSESDPPEAFKQMVSNADNGTLFIDEAYNFNPAPPGSTANASNKVLDYLMKVSETKRETITFILAGYKEEILNLLTYNPGFPSRFPKDFTFEFPDYTESQLRRIFVGMIKERKFRLQSKKECGVSISKVIAQRLAKGVEKKGFGNARAVRVKLDGCIVEQSNRLGTLQLHGKPIANREYATLTRGDTIGDRPDFASSPVLKELDGMIGLGKVKSAIRGLMHLQLQNYDNELRGERVQHISLHRVFFGNAGTGKTTVARLYGRLLKEFGFLSDGDLIEVKPSDLKGSAVGEAATRTAAIIESARGKVLFIDEAYGLDPTRNNNSFGGDVIDTIVEKIEGSAGSDMAVILAGYEPQMRALFKNSNNQGLARRFNLTEALEFEDFSDEDLKKVLLNLVRKEMLCIKESTVDFSIKQIAQRRRLDNFGNAAEVAQILDRAKLKLASRKQAAAEAAFSNRTTSKGSSSPMRRGAGRNNAASKEPNDISTIEDDSSPQSPTVCDPYELIESDFIREETSADNAREALADLENVEHVLELLQELEDTLRQAKSENRAIADILDDAHLIFTGPPGTGKTTVAQRFGIMFQQLELLPLSHVEVVTAANLISRYVGNTGPNVVEAMRRAKGGILFIDEAYGMVPRSGSFGGEAIQALLDNITMPEFRGNLIIILAGYHDHIEELFTANAGFRSRFDKRRLDFPEWTSTMATRATIKKIERDGLSLSLEATEILPVLYSQLSSLPDWGSARDVYRTILPTMYSKRSKRLGQQARLERNEKEENNQNQSTSSQDNNNNAVASKAVSRRAVAQKKSATPPAAPYELIDVMEAFKGCLSSRGGAANNSHTGLKYNESDYVYEDPLTNRPLPPAVTKIVHKTNVLFRTNDENGDGKDNVPDISALLEEACAELGYSLEKIEGFLTSGIYPEELLQLLLPRSKCKDTAELKELLNPQRGVLLKKVKEAIIELKRKKTQEEQLKLDKVRRLGLCPMAFEWIKCEGGYRCAGGSHFVTEDQVNKL